MKYCHISLMVDNLSDFSKGQAFERFHCYKQVYIVTPCNVCILFILYFSLFLPPFLFIVYFVCTVCIFSFDATILVNKDVYNKSKLGAYTIRMMLYIETDQLTEISLQWLNEYSTPMFSGDHYDVEERYLARGKFWKQSACAKCGSRSLRRIWFRVYRWPYRTVIVCIENNVVAVIQCSLYSAWSLSLTAITAFAVFLH